MKRMVLATVASGLWIGFSEFLRNEFLFKDYWLEKYEALGQSAPPTPILPVISAHSPVISEGRRAYFRLPLRHLHLQAIERPPWRFIRILHRIRSTRARFPRNM